jgi:hypothetical protein
MGKLFGLIQTEEAMRNVMRLLAAGAIAAATAACVGDTGYYGNSYGYPSSSYYPSPTYNSGYGYAYNTAPRRPSRYGPNGDYDRDGIPNKYDRDANGDGVPDRYQR